MQPEKKDYEVVPQTDAKTWEEFWKSVSEYDAQKAEKEEKPK